MNLTRQSVPIFKVHSSRAKFEQRVVRFNKSGATVDSANLLLGVRQFRHRTARYEEVDQIGVAHGITYVIIGVANRREGCQDNFPGFWTRQQSEVTI